MFESLSIETISVHLLVVANFASAMACVSPCGRRRSGILRHFPKKLPRRPTPGQQGQMPASGGAGQRGRRVKAEAAQFPITKEAGTRNPRTIADASTLRKA